MARLSEQRKATAYRIYVTDALRIIAANTAKFGGGEFIISRYCDIIKPPPEETRTGEEIIAHILGKLEVRDA